MMSNCPPFNLNFPLIASPYHTNLMSTYTMIFLLHSKLKIQAFIALKTLTNSLPKTLLNIVLSTKTSMHPPLSVAELDLMND